MGFFRGPDKIGTLSHSAGVISLGLPSLSLVNRYTIGGQQYDFSSLNRTISADVTLVANTLYFVYALVSGGTVVMRISTSAPSVYKNANPTSELIGAFYSDNGSPIGLGSFITIDGPPTTQGMIESNIGELQADTGTAIFGWSEFKRMRWSRKGDRFVGLVQYYGNTSGNGAGSNAWLIPLIFPTIQPFTSNTQGHRQRRLGAGLFVSNSVAGSWTDMHFQAYDATRAMMQVGRLSGGTNLITIGSVTVSLSGGYSEISGDLDYPVDGWTNTALKDL